MKIWLLLASLLGLMIVGTSSLHAQDIFDVFPSDEGPWSDIDNTTVVVPMVPDGSITLDGVPSSVEYGAFVGREVIPVTNAWVLDWPGDRQWDGPEDSSFTFWLAHDTDYLYVGVNAKDDVVNSDDPNAAFWKDDSIEIIVDALNDNYDINTDTSMDLYGGHNYVNFEGRFSAWDEEFEEVAGTTWSTDVDWTWGETDDADADITGFGQETEGGWTMETRFHKRLFEDPEAGNKLVEGYRMGFNIGMDDDDRFGPGPEGDASRSQDLELQYWWANRLRPVGYTDFEAEDYTDEEIESLAYFDDFPLEIDSGGRLTHGGAGDIVFGGLVDSVTGDFNGDMMLDVQDINLLTEASASGKNEVAFDLTGDDLVDAADVKTWIKDLKTSWLGDANVDGEFNSGDLVQVFAGGKYEQEAAANWEQGDWNGDGLFDSGDLVTAFADGGYEQGPPARAMVPEPSGIALLLTAMAGLLLLRRR